MKCKKCVSEKEPYFSRTEPMGYFCPDCGSCSDCGGTGYIQPTDSDGSTPVLKCGACNFPNDRRQESTAGEGKP